MLSHQQQIRYSRQLLLPEIDEAGQLALAKARILIVGLGGLGCAVSAYLAGAGAGELILVDDDVVSLSNLPRQLLYTSENTGQRKVDVAKKHLLGINPDITIHTQSVRLTHDSPYTAGSPDILIDCTDNLSSRFYLNTLSRQFGIPLVSGAAQGFDGHFIVFSGHPTSACFGCLYTPSQQADGDCLSQGISGPVVGMIGMMQAQAVLNYIVGITLPSNSYLHRLNGKTLQWRQLLVNKNPNCTECGTRL